MPFRFKDLMIDVVGKERNLCQQPSLQHLPCANLTINAPCGFHTILNALNAPCGFHTIPYWACGDTFQACGGTVTPCGGSFVDPTTLADHHLVQFSATDLQQLQKQLETTLVKLKERDQAHEAASRPQTRAEAEELEGKLKDALQELQQHKKELK